MTVLTHYWPTWADDLGTLAAMAVLGAVAYGLLVLA